MSVLIAHPIVDPLMHETQVVMGAMQNEGWTRDMLSETSLYFSDIEASYARDQRALAIEMGSRAWELKDSWERIHMPWFNDFHNYGDENMQYFMDEQWTPEDIHAHLEQGRRPYEFNMLAPYINAICGEQIGRRNEWRAIPENSVSEPFAEVASHFLKWVQQSNHNQWEQTESDIFRDNAVRGLGVCSVMLDPRDPFGSVKIGRELPQEFSWDIYSAKDGTVQDSKFLRRNYWVDRVSLASQYKEWAPEILSLFGKIMSTSTLSYFNTLKKPRVRSLASGNGYSTQFDTHFQTVYGGMVNVTEFYHRRYLAKWKVVDGNLQETHYFDTEQDAIGAASELMQFWMQDEVRQAYGVARPLVSHPMPVDVAVIDQYVWAGDQLLRVTTTMNDRYPYEFFMDSYYDGNVVSYLARGKGRQRFYNRMISLIDMMVGAAKPQLAIDKGFLAEEMTAEKIQQSSVDPTHIWIFDSNKREGFKASDAFTTTPAVNYGPAVQALTQTIHGSIENFYGGSTMVGQADYSGQSGISQQTLQAIGTTTTASIFDKFNDFGKRVGEQALYLSRYVDAAVRMPVMDDDGGVTISSFDDEGVHSMAELKYRVKIVEQQASQSEKAQRMRDLDTLAGQAPEIVPFLLPLKLKYAGIAYSDRKQIQSAMQASQEQQQQQQQIESERQYGLEKQKIEIQQGNLDVKIGLLELAERNPVKVMATRKLGGGPLQDAALLEHAGIDAHPTTVAADWALQKLMEQDAADVAQEHFNKIERRTGLHDIEASIAHAKSAGGSHQGSAKSTHGTTTPKDKSARSRKGVTVL
jgi:hypothetical protein